MKFFYEISSPGRGVVAWTKNKFSNTQDYDHASCIEFDYDEGDYDTSLNPDWEIAAIEDNNDIMSKTQPTC